MQGTSLEELVRYLEEKGVLKSTKIKEALLRVDRRKYVPKNLREFVYHDSPLVIAEGQTISQPTTVVFMLELLAVQPGNKILDIGAGSAWVSCLMANVAGDKGRVYAYEINDVVGMMGQNNVEKAGVKNVEYRIGDAEKYWQEQAPYDRIYVGAAFETIPAELKELLAIDGILVAPTQDGHICKVVRLAEAEFKEEKFYGFVFVPFVKK